MGEKDNVTAAVCARGRSLDFERSSHGANRYKKQESAGGRSFLVLGEVA